MTAATAEALDNAVEAPRRSLGLKDILALHDAAITELRDNFAKQRTEFDILRAEVDHLNAAAVSCEACGSSPCANPDFCRLSRNIDRARARQPAPPAPEPRPTPQTTVEAILYSVRERGIAALKEPANQERLHRCDAAARRLINERIDRLQKAGGAR